MLFKDATSLQFSGTNFSCCRSTDAPGFDFEARSLGLKTSRAWIKQLANAKARQGLSSHTVVFDFQFLPTDASWGCAHRSSTANFSQDLAGLTPPGPAQPARVSAPGSPHSALPACQRAVTANSFQRGCAHPGTKEPQGGFAGWYPSM